MILSEEQIRAVRSSAENLLIDAPPGCGKTEVLAHRIAHQITFLEKNQRILALTFTKRARTNLEARIHAIIPQPQFSRKVLVRNFHGFATEVVLAHGRTIGLGVEDIRLPDQQTMRSAVNRACGDSKEGFAAEELLSSVKRHPLKDQQVLEELLKQEQTRARNIAIQIERERQEQNQLHYDDLLRHAQVLFRIPAVARLYQAHFGAVIVDEYQDLSIQQLELALRVSEARRTFAGDRMQGIFSWAGAAPDRVESELGEVCSERIRLKESYRSSPSVLQAVNSIGTKLDPESSVIAAAGVSWPRECVASRVVFKDMSDEAEQLRAVTSSLLRKNPDASVGIICRSNWRRKEIDRAFSEGIGYPVRRWDLAIDDPVVLNLINSTISTLPRNTSIAEARTLTLDSVDDADVDTRALLNDAFDSLAKTGTDKIWSAMQTVYAPAPEEPVGPGVHLLTAHSGKGQQFDWVFVVGLEDGHVPDFRSTGEQLTEEKHILLVMLSRARFGVVTTRVEKKLGRNGWFDARPSRWWNEIKTDSEGLPELEKRLSIN